MIRISIVNNATAFSDADLPAMVNALQLQVERDFYPFWGVMAQLYWTSAGFHPTADHWVISLLDDADQAGALGYHDVTPTGMPLGKVFVKTTLSAGDLVSVTASHELLEMLVDPDINLSAEVDDSSGAPAKFYAYEVGDPVELDSDGYDITIPEGWNGAGKVIRVSDFATPAWFESFNKVGPYDAMRRLNGPFTLRPGGYLSLLDLGNLGAGWQQITARFGSLMTERGMVAARPRPGSRRSRRVLPRSQWIASTYDPEVEVAQSNLAGDPAKGKQK